MAYEKPKVTIELDEYNELIEKAKQFQSDEYLIAAKKIVFHLLESQGGRYDPIQKLRQEGIDIFISNDTMRERVWGNVEIKLLK